MIKYIKNTNICVRKEIIPFVNINLLSTQSKWILLTQVKEIISSFGLYYTLMSGFLNMEMWSCGSWADHLIPVSKDR